MISEGLSVAKIGSVGEVYVRYKLLRWGHQAYIVDQDNKYDILVVGGDRPIKVQVKSTLSPARPGSSKRKASYKFSVRHSGKFKSYEEGDCDIIACVALDLERVFFMPRIDTTCKRISARKFTRENEHDTWLSSVAKLAGNG